MTIKQIRQSGILELYVLGDLSMHQNKMIHAYITLFPELKKDLMDIEKTLYVYAKIHAIPPSTDLISSIFQ